jgi:autotransporter-associated beta strand protein
MFALPASAQINTTSGATITVSNTSLSSGTTTISGGSLTLTSANTYTGATTISGGTLILNNTTDLTTNVSTLNLSSGLTKTGAGTLTLTGATTYTGATTINSGTLVLSSGYTSASNLVVNGGTLRLDSGATLAGNITLNSGSVVLSNGNVLTTNTGAGTLSGATLVTSGSTLTLANSGVITIGAGNGTLVTGIFGQTLSFGSVSYPAPTDGQKAQLGAALDFERFRQHLTLLNSSIKPRSAAAPPASAFDFSYTPFAPTALAVGGDGAIYGVVPGGGVTNAGGIVKIVPGAPQATVTTVASLHFDQTGSAPGPVLIDDGAGRLLGVTRVGGAHGKGTIFRFDPADGSLTNVFDFPADLAGVANGLAVGTDGTIYGISSALAEAERLEVASAFHGNPLNDASAFNEVGATLSAHGSIFRVGSSGEFAVLKGFDASEATVAGSLPPPIVTGSTLSYPGGPITQPATSAHTFFPCKIALVNGGLYAWVSGGLYQLSTDGVTALWTEPTAMLEVPGYNSTNFGGSVLFLAPPERFFGRVENMTSSGSTVVFTDEAPPLQPHAATPPETFETLFYARDSQEVSTALGSLIFSPRSTGTSAPPANNSGLSLRSRIRGVVPTTTGRYRVDVYPAGGAAVVHVAANVFGNSARVLADFDRVLAVLARPGTEDLIVVATPQGGTVPSLYVLNETSNVPPVAPDVDKRARFIEPSTMDYFVDLSSVGSDPNGDAIELASWTQGAHGSVTQNAGGGPLLRYKPDDGFLGAHDSFTYTLRDSFGAEATGTITIGNALPIAVADRAEKIGVDADGATLFRAELLANDTDANGDPLSALVVLAQNDPVTISKSDDGNAVIFRVPPNGLGYRTAIAYALTDGIAMSVGQVSFANHNPVATGSCHLNADAGGAAAAACAGIANDPDGDALSFTLFTQPTHGFARIEAGAIIYNAAPGYVGNDAFKVQASDGNGGVLLVPVQVNVPFANWRGPLVGIIGDAGDWRGSLHVNVSTMGKATLVLRTGNRRFSAKLDLASAHTVTFRGTNIEVDFAQDRREATVTMHGTEYQVDLAKMDEQHDFAGQYNVILERHSAVPMHYGFAVVRIDHRGHARLSGRMPDGTAWSSSAAVTEGLALAIVGQFGAGGSVAGFWSLDDSSEINAITGDLSWSRSSGRESLLVGGAHYRATRPGLNVFNQQQTAASLTFSAPGLPALTSELTLNGANLATFTSAKPPYGQVSVNRASGVFSGYVILTDKPLLPSLLGLDAFASHVRELAVPFTGVLRGATGFGVLGSGSNSGSVVLLPHFRNIFQSYGLHWEGPVISGGFEETALGAGVSFTTPVPSNPTP